jgi:polar amino acid transport system substrate-binding protein
MTLRSFFRAPLSSRLVVVVGLAACGPVMAQTAACEPGKLAQKYPSLVGKTLKIGVDAQTPPYVMRDPKQFNNLIGFDADLARKVFDCAGIKYEFFVGGWSGLLPALNAKQIDVFWNNLYYTADRAKQVNFVTYMQAGTGALAAAGNPKKITGFDQLCGTTVAVGVGTVEEPQVRAEDAKCKAAGKPGVTVMVFPDVAAGTRLVQSGRADAMLYDLALIDSLAKENPKIYSRAFKVLSGLSIGVAVSKDAPDLLNAVRDGLAVMQATQQQKAIFEKYTIDPDLQVAAEIKTR